MRYALGAVGIVWTCACGNVTAQMFDAHGSDPKSDGGSPDAMCAAGPELLDGKDNDCDGQIDNGFWTTVITTPITTLAARDAKCSDAAAITADAYECQLAVRRECQARGYSAGFRPVAVTTTDVTFTCVADVHMVSAVSYAELQRYILACAPGTAFQTPCFAAIKRYCEKQGFKTGIGPLNVDTNASLDLLCTNHADYAGMTVEDVRSMAPSCNLPTTSPWDFSCFHTYYEYCRSRGWTSAWGPVEYDGTVVYAACLNDRPR